MAVRIIFGCGYLGSRVARRWRDMGDEVHVLTRSIERARQWQASGLIPHVGDVTDPASLSALPICDTALIAVGFDRASGHSMRHVFVQGLSHTLDALPAGTGRVIFVSSTGVYGQTEGETVDETSACEPTREGGHACLEAEQVLMRHALGPRSIRLRLAGIYGPGRIPHLEQLRAGQLLDVPPDSLLNLVHVDDAAATVLAAAQRAPLPSLYVVSDGHPVRRREFYAEVARLVGADAPRFGAPDTSKLGTRRSSVGDKRVEPRRLLAELRPPWLYPSYVSGLAASLANA